MLDHDLARAAGSSDRSGSGLSAVAVLSGLPMLPARSEVQSQSEPRDEPTRDEPARDEPARDDRRAAHSDRGVVVLGPAAQARLASRAAGREPELEAPAAPATPAASDDCISWMLRTSASPAFPGAPPAPVRSLAPIADPPGRTVPAPSAVEPVAVVAVPARPAPPPARPQSTLSRLYEASSAPRALVPQPVPTPRRPWWRRGASSAPQTAALLAGDPAQLRSLASSGTASGYAAAAESTEPTDPGLFTNDPVLHLARRATFGPRPSDIADLRAVGIDAWLTRQLAPESISDTVADEVWALFCVADSAPDADHSGFPLLSWDTEWRTAQASLARQVFSQRQLYEQVVDVLAGHLHVAAPGEAWDSTPSFVTEVIRPHALGRYRDLLLAGMRHPAMMQYLDDGPPTALAHERLGRELLELHTNGLGDGYGEADVVASARALTGRVVTDGRFAYRPEDHVTGPVSVLGWSSANPTAAGGLAVGDDYLTYLAALPTTARTLARRLAVRFVSDSPPEGLVDRLAAVYLANDTDLRPVLDCLFRSREFWVSTGQKTRQPLEDVVGAVRVLDLRPGPGTRSVVETLYGVVRANGYAPQGWDPPLGTVAAPAAGDDAGGVVTRWTMLRALVNDWWQGLTVTPMLDLVPLRPGLTAGQWVDELSLRLVGQTMTPARRDAIVAVANGIGPTDPAVEASSYAWTLIPLILDSRYFRQR